ncbi:GTP pyrophosphokinase [Rubeoparvulum massiliense]|uniref:GTP pyrophosphokinase n=1 Tax=Rubeoparvulum massiliense TaxID=1631346 RepID=UPI00065E8B75|nr:GTP pyrophosphokinase family protein [Rubeoparvulum massiliense]
MDGRDWNKFLIPYEQAVEELKVKFRSIRKELKKRSEYSPIEFVTGRVKQVSSILEKSKKLAIPLDRLEEEMEDIAGIRIMCQFVEDIERVVNHIRQRNDFTIAYEKDYVNHQKTSGYRSYHIVIRYPLQTIYGEKEILAEIQIRTLAMNFWATIEHSLNYKYKQQLPEPIQERLRKAAEAAFQLDREMSTIREEIMDAQMMFANKSDLMATTLNRIQELYASGHVEEAQTIQEQFMQLWVAEDMTAIYILYQHLNQRIEEIKQI